jgi:hypothetical protein
MVDAQVLNDIAEYATDLDMGGILLDRDGGRPRKGPVRPVVEDK